MLGLLNRQIKDLQALKVESERESNEIGDRYDSCILELNQIKEQLVLTQETN